LSSFNNAQITFVHSIMSSDLLEIFNARSGIICCVGAGGKKTTMYRLAKEHHGRVGITATSHIEYFPRTLFAIKYIDTENELLNKVKHDQDSRVIAFAQPSERKGRRAGISPDIVQTFKDEGRFDLLLIKADGARNRFIKAPAAHEPPVPDCVDIVIPVISAKVIGQPLTEKIAHRVELITRVTGVNENEVINPVHIARLLASPDGALKNTGSAKVIPLINMVDNREREQLAREAAITALSMSDRFEYMVLAAMKNDNPIIDIIKN
jgi:probable selenium-dependent hydroxylase accessory protein YqeC